MDGESAPADAADGEPELAAAPGGARAAGAGPADEPDDLEPGEIPVAPVPRATPLPRRAPAPAAPLRQPNRSTTLPPRRPVPTAPRRGGGDSHRTRNGVLAGLGVVVILVGALFATGVFGGSDEDQPPTAPNQTSENPTAEPSSTTARSLTPATTKVAVLNGTTIGGLASTEADKLREAGYTGEVTTGNNTDQQRAESLVHVREPRTARVRRPAPSRAGSTSRRSSGSTGTRATSARTPTSW